MYSHNSSLLVTDIDNAILFQQDMYSRDASLLVSASAPILDHEIVAEGHRDLSPELLEFLGLMTKEVGTA